MDDVREALRLNHQDIVGLNFIRDAGAYVFRRHHRTGLRSHIMELLDHGDVKRESEGVMTDGLRQYPRAEPLKMLRIFRTRFPSLKEAERELKRVRIIQAFLSPHFVARSEEFLVDYAGKEHRSILLCGLQEYVKGEMVKPWTHLDKNYLESLSPDMSLGQENETGQKKWIEGVRRKAEGFVAGLKRMILQAGYVPDLAGVGNLLLDPSGYIKLVDINNVSKVSFDQTIRLDDRGFPVCDTSIRVIWLLEKTLFGRPPQREDPIYETFLEPGRVKQVRKLEEAFQHSLGIENSPS